MIDRTQRRCAVLVFAVLLAGLARSSARAETGAGPERRWCGTGSGKIDDPKPKTGDHIVVPPKPKPGNALPRPPKGAKLDADVVVMVNAHITARGDVDAVDVHAGSEPMVSEVVRAVCRWKYEPATLDGSPFPVWKAIRVEPPPKAP